MIVSPALPVIDIACSDDFEELVIVEQMGVVAGETAPFISRMMPIISASRPYVRLKDEETAYVAGEAGRIFAREKMVPQADILRQMNDRVLALMRLKLILEVLYEIASQASPTDEKSSRGEQVFVRFMQSLTDGRAKRKSVAEYAAEASLSVRHFSWLVHRYTGQTPTQWIAAVTVGRAKSLLRQPQLSVKEVADRLGFPEQFTFRKYFKKNTGLSPTEYRKGGDTLSSVVSRDD